MAGGVCGGGWVDGGGTRILLIELSSFDVLYSSLNAALLRCTAGVSTPTSRSTAVAR
jgi:hypothetical protein